VVDYRLTSDAPTFHTTGQAHSGVFRVANLAIGDVARLRYRAIKIGDLVCGGKVRTRATVVQQKTNRPVEFELQSDARASLLTWLKRRGGALTDYVFPSRIDHSAHLSTRQYTRLVDEWVTEIGLQREEYGTHSLRRTKASIIYKATGNLRAVQILLGHSKIENTVRYLGVDVEDALALAEATEI
jgi:integrase